MLSLRRESLNASSPAEPNKRFASTAVRELSMTPEQRVLGRPATGHRNSRYWVIVQCFLAARAALYFERTHRGAERMAARTAVLQEERLGRVGCRQVLAARVGLRPRVAVAVGLSGDPVGLQVYAVGGDDVLARRQEILHKRRRSLQAVGKMACQNAIAGSAPPTNYSLV